MKRVKAAIIAQTLHFLPKDDISSQEAAQSVANEVKADKGGLEKSGSLYKILSEETLPDGSVILEVKKQYSTSPVGNYLD